MSTLMTTTLAAALLAGCDTKSESADLITGPDTFTTRIEVGWAEVGFEPLPGATVALDDVDGNRQEAVTDTDGLVGFYVDWDDGPFDLTVDPGVAGLPLFSAMDRGALDDGLTVRFHDDSVLDDRVTLYGLIEPAAVEHPLPLSYVNGRAVPSFPAETYLNAHGAAGSELQTSLSAYAVQVMPGVDFELMAVRMQQHLAWPDSEPLTTYDDWTLYTLDGITEHTRLDLALGENLDATNFESSFLLPADRLDPLRSDDVVSSMRVVATVDGDLANTCGFPTWMARTDDGERFELAGRYVTPGYADAPITELMAVDAATGVGSVAVIAGTPETWRGEPELLPIPVVHELSRNDADSFTLSFEEHELDGVRTFAQVYGNDGTLMWEVIGDEGTTLVLPAPPSSVEPALHRQARTVVPYLVRELALQVTHYAWAEGIGIVPVDGEPVFAPHVDHQPGPVVRIAANTGLPELHEPW